MSESTKALNWSELDAYDRCLRMQTRLQAIERLLWDSCNRGHRGPASPPRDVDDEFYQAHGLIEELLEPMGLLVDNLDQEIREAAEKRFGKSPAGEGDQAGAMDPPAAAETDQVTGIREALRSLAELPDEVIRTAYQAADLGDIDADLNRWAWQATCQLTSLKWDVLPAEFAAAAVKMYQAARGGEAVRS